MSLVKSVETEPPRKHHRKDHVASEGKYLGVYSTEKEAHEAHLKAKEKLHIEYISGNAQKEQI